MLEVAEVMSINPSSSMMVFLIKISAIEFESSYLLTEIANNIRRSNFISCNCKSCCDYPGTRGV